MKTILIAFLLILTCGPLAAQPISDPLKVGIDQHPGEQVPLSIRLRDENGREQTLSELLGGKPALLVLGYYGCPMLCHKVQDGLVDGLADSKVRLGRDFRVLTVSVDPAETSELAKQKKASYLQAYGKPVGPSDWPFLVGDSKNLGILQKAVGFRTAKLKGQISHPAGMVVLTPQGKVSSYLLGVRFPALALEKAIEKASREEHDSFLQPVILLCYQYDPSTGKYSLAIYRVIQLLGLATVLLVGAAVLYWKRRERSQKS